MLARADVRDRPAPEVWSPLEYAAHTRDVVGLFHERISLLLEKDDPRFGSWDGEQVAVDSDYGAQDPAVVAAENPAIGDWLYFVTVDTAGTTLFANTFEDHIRNRQVACRNKLVATGCSQ